jgi:AraC-like DNA-binding protein
MSRLSQARQALMSADSGSATVTEIATTFGFAELGRFSVEYRKVYGESPSETLCRTAAMESPNAAKSRAGSPMPAASASNCYAALTA